MEVSIPDEDQADSEADTVAEEEAEVADATDKPFDCSGKFHLSLQSFYQQIRYIYINALWSDEIDSETCQIYPFIHEWDLISFLESVWI